MAWWELPWSGLGGLLWHHEAGHREDVGCAGDGWEGPSAGVPPCVHSEKPPRPSRAVLGAEGSLLPIPQGAHSWVGHAGIQEVLICPEWSLFLGGEQDQRQR